MNNFFGLFGVDIAIKKLRPDSQFELYNTTFTKWFDPNGNQPPTWDEINEQIEKDKKEIENGIIHTT
jgi:hypothetical protein